MNKSIRRILFIILMFLSSCFNIRMVLANEIIDNDVEVTSDYKVYINDKEVVNYDLIDDTSVKITQEYNGNIEGCYYDNGNDFLIDYSNKLYGSYNYKFSLICDEEIVDSKEVTINYIGDNSDIINVSDIYYYDNTYFILKKLDRELKVLDVIDMFDNIDMYGASLGILNESGEILLSDDIVDGGDKLRLSAVYQEYGSSNYIEEEFFIELVDDINNDGVIDYFDIKCLFVDDVMNGNINIKDVVNIGSDDIIDSTDTLDKTVETVEEVYVNGEFEVKYYISGLVNDSLDGVIGKINYDKNNTELISVSVKNGYGIYDGDGKFIYVINRFDKDGLFITFRFRAKTIGNINISLDEIEFITSSGDNINIKAPLFISDVLVLDYGKGGDVEDNSDDDTKVDEIGTNDKKVQTLKRKKNTSIVEIYEELLPARSTKYIALSTDNYIKGLKIKGYDIEFDKDILEYSIKVGDDVDKLDLDIELNDNDAYYVVIGNKDFKEGSNKVSIVVTSLDGSVRTYVINVEKDGKTLEESDIEKEKETSRNIIILLIILIIIGLVYIIFKDDEE